ncbi:unnamed protein product [Blepharisma stoltei]|uniref:Proteasome subunit alpha type n=1 Tax=Blepharisma stoltei TaxID=1481888 RepID=A0AAU9J6B0_9CILI|nr:unnamed protein product [Blepharisma stoltei]
MANSKFSLTTFSSQGKLTQIEYALVAVEHGDTCLGIKARDGVVLATEKKFNSILVDETSVSKAAVISDHIGASYAGITADFRVLMQKARKYAISYKSTYHEPVPSSQLCQELSTVVQEFTQSGGVRPFGVSILLASFDHEGPHLYQVDPSGAYFSWKAAAIGKNMTNAKSFLERRYNEEQGLEDAIHTALMTLKEGFEGEMNEHNIELAVVGADKLFRVLTPNETRDYLSEIQ